MEHSFHLAMFIFSIYCKGMLDTFLSVNKSIRDAAKDMCHVWK